MNDVKLFLESCQSLMLYALVTLSLGVLTISLAVALIKSVKISAVKICRYGLLGVFFMSAILGIGVSIGSVKVPGDPTNQVQQGQVSGRPLRRPGGWPPCQPSGLGVPLRSGCSQVQITDEDITNCWRVAEMREGCEIVGRDAFDSPQIHEDWLIRGGFIDVVRIPAVGWSFPWRDGLLEGMTVFSDGGLRPALRTPYFPPPFEAPLAVVPSFNWNLLPGGVSNVFWHAVSPSNSLVVTWENSPVGLDVNSITNFQAELFANGSFEYRYDDRTVGYAPVFPFDWDGDGLENSVDPEPLVAGPDAHGTNVEWYNVVCSNVYEAAEGGPGAVSAMADTDISPPGIVLLPRTFGVNTNAYYFVEVVASRGPAPIYFTADRESRLGSPVVIAREGETNYVPLLMGIEYAVTSTVPITVSSVCEHTEIEVDGPARYTVRWPLEFDFTESVGEVSRIYTVSVEPYDPDGDLTWNGASSGGGLRSAGSSPGCSCGCLSCGGSSVWFTCSPSCTCDAGCRAVGNYSLEGASFEVTGGMCRCGFEDPSWGVPAEHGGGASLTITFSKQAVIFEDEYENVPGVSVPKRSSRVRISVDAYGGTYGGALSFSSGNLGKLTPIGTGVALPSTGIALASEESFHTTGVYEGSEASSSEDDVSVSGTFSEFFTAQQLSDSNALTVVRVELTPWATAAENPCSHRHFLGIGENVNYLQYPSMPQVTWFSTSGWAVSSVMGQTIFSSPLVAGKNGIRVTCRGQIYIPLLMVIEPEGIVAINAAPVRFGVPKGEAGGIGMNLDLYVLPRTVSFGNIAMQEVPCLTGSHSGYFDNQEFAGLWSHSRACGAGTWYDIGNDNYFFKDTPRISSSLPRMMDDGTITTNKIYGWQYGTVDWDVPLGWGERGTRDDSGQVGQLEGYEQSFRIYENGRSGVSKFFNQITRQTNDVVRLNGVLKP